jgi:hypothetical protein
MGKQFVMFPRKQDPNAAAQVLAPKKTNHAQP